MSKISLNASMRSNLLSLQQISKLQDRTQLRLSTGLKVNSAIDNPGSYYTAQSLNNRADDLSALLDSMGQSIQTIKAANEGLEKAEDLISQMKAIAEQVNASGSYVPDKSYFIKEVGANGAVVSTADELRDAVNSGKETICVYGKIDLGDISATGGLQLQENQKLVGVNYFGNYKDGEGFSSISATDSVTNHSLIDIKKTGCLVSDLSLSYENTVITGNAYVIKSEGVDVVTDLQNLDIIAKFSDDKNATAIRSAIASINQAENKIKDSINIQTSGQFGYGILTSNKAHSTIHSNANVNIIILGYNSHGICNNNFSELNVERSAAINISTSNQSSYGIYSFQNSLINIETDSSINISTSGISGNGISSELNSIINISGRINISAAEGYGIITSANNSGNQINIYSTSEIYIASTKDALRNGYNNGQGNNIFKIAVGAKLALEKNNTIKWYKVQKDYRDENTSTSASNSITSDNIDSTLNVASTSSWKTPADIIVEQEKEATEQAEKEKKNYEAYQKQFNSALSQYDMLINDSMYKGINLLKEDTLKVNFNEDKSAHLMVQGVDVTSDALGLISADWQTDKDVQTSLNQVLSVRNKLRTAASQLGNYYSIITERQNFTENLINVLTEGADKLTLADMNEESANMLSLQTQQNLAVNSLSLASQASQAVLKLF